MPFEVQIRTREMDLIAENGIAAHWKYKEGEASRAQEAHVGLLRQILETTKDVSDPREFLSSLRIDLYPDEVYIFSPKGAVFAFPRGATPVDFAYRVHTDVGHHTTGARVNGRLVPLKTPLENGDIVEILTSPSSQPSRDWLSFVLTSRAKNKIRAFIHTAEKEKSVEIGRRLLDRELKKWKKSLPKLLDAKAFDAAARGLRRREGGGPHRGHRLRQARAAGRRREGSSPRREARRRRRSPPASPRSGTPSGGSCRSGRPPGSA